MVVIVGVSFVLFESPRAAPDSSVELQIVCDVNLPFVEDMVKVLVNLLLKIDLFI